MPNARVLIVEDEPIIAEDIADCIDSIDFVNAGIAYDSETALDMMINRYPDVVLLDIQIEGSMNGIDLAKIIRAHHKLPFVFLTSHADKATLDEAKFTLPYGYIVKPFNEKDIVSSLELALFRHASENKGGNFNLDRINSLISDPLTSREFECLKLLFDGLTNKQMAEKQFVSVNTIKTHLRNLFSKLDVPNRTTAINKVSKLK